MSSPRIGRTEARVPADFFTGLARPHRVRHDCGDTYTPAEDAGPPRPAVVFVHGGPVPEGRVPTPRDSAVFAGYGALAASAGLAGVTFDHRLYSPEHYPVAAADVADAVERACGLVEVDPERVVLWFFSGGGALAADWLRTTPPWLRGIAWTYPVLAPPPDWPGDVARFDCVRAVTAAPRLPKLLVRVGAEYPTFATTQEAMVEAARAGESDLEVLDIPASAHGYETQGHALPAREVTEQAMKWVAGILGG